MSAARSVALSLGVAVVLSASASVADTASVADQMTAAAVTLRDSLSGDDLDDASYAFDDDERFDLRLAPFFLEGLELADMNEASAARLGDLLEASMGPVGRKKADAIRHLEDEVVRMEDENAWHIALVARITGVRGDDAYFFSLYGDPASGDRWGYRFDGHHLSANFTVVGDDVSPTPLFLGAQPREIPEDGLGPAGLRVLADEEDTARALYQSLDADQRAQATLPLELDRDLFIGSGDRVDPAAPVGIAGADLLAEQAKLLDALLEAYLQNVAGPVAARERARIDAAGRDEIRFAWAGSTTPGEEIYYRLQGPTLLIEFDNTVDDADHIHALWRDPSGDFGRDLLRQHHEAAHASQASKE